MTLALNAVLLLAVGCETPGDAADISLDEDKHGGGHHGPRDVTLTALGTYETGIFNQAATEITAYDAHTERLFVVSGTSTIITVLDISDPGAPVKVSEIDVAPVGGGANSIASHGGLLAVAVEGFDRTEPGVIAFYNAHGTLLRTVPAGVVPDMVKFSTDHRYVLTANEGEPNADYSIDPEGSITIVDLRRGVHRLRSSDVRQLDFRAWNGRVLDPSIRIYGPNATVAQDLEPEYIAVDAESRYAYVTLQENNAIAVVDIRRGCIVRLMGLGFKDHNLPGNGFDASDRDNAINIAAWPTMGMYQPDSIAAVEHRGQTYLLTANEGDARAWGSFVDEVRFNSASYVLDPVAFPNAATLKLDTNLGRVRVSPYTGDTDGDGDFDVIHTFGSRSMTVFRASGSVAWDSGDELEQMTAALYPANFNASHDANTRDARSTSKGPEPEALTVADLEGRTYAFLGLERIGGIVVYDVTNPRTPQMISYQNDRDFAGTPSAGTAGDLGPEGLLFIDACDSPNGEPLLVVSNEVSGSVTVYQIDVD